MGGGGRMGGWGGAGAGGWGDLSTLTKFPIWWPDVPKSPLEHTIPEILQKSLYYLSIANELDREHWRIFRGETETEIARNSNVLVDFEIRT